MSAARTLLQSTQVYIGTGYGSHILYAGPALGEISGLVQINALIQQDAEVGDAVPIAVVSSENNTDFAPAVATIAVR
jgi:uncharacterized protein (TIGR03437 family)